jgi:hypothetical protein
MFLRPRSTPFLPPQPAFAAGQKIKIIYPEGNRAEFQEEGRYR